MACGVIKDGLCPALLRIHKSEVKLALRTDMLTKPAKQVKLQTTVLALCNQIIQLCHLLCLAMRINKK